MIFTTTNGSTYIVNEKDRTITGGVFGNEIAKYTSLSAIVGSKGHIVLSDGRQVNTSIIKKYSNPVWNSEKESLRGKLHENVARVKTTYHTKSLNRNNNITR